METCWETLVMSLPHRVSEGAAWAKLSNENRKGVKNLISKVVERGSVMACMQKQAWAVLYEGSSQSRREFCLGSLSIHSHKVFVLGALIFILHEIFSLEVLVLIPIRFLHWGPWYPFSMKFSHSMSRYSFPYGFRVGSLHSLVSTGVRVKFWN